MYALALEAAIPSSATAVSAEAIQAERIRLTLDFDGPSRTWSFN